MELGWARRTGVKVAEEGSGQAERGSGDDCDDEDGCGASGDEEDGESPPPPGHTNKDMHVQRLYALRVHGGISKVLRREEPGMLSAPVLQPLGIFEKKPEGGRARRDVSPLTLSSGFCASARSSSSFRCSQHFVPLFLFSDRIKDALTSRSPCRKKKNNKKTPQRRKKRNIKINCNNSFISSLLIHFSYAWCHT